MPQAILLLAICLSFAVANAQVNPAGQTVQINGMEMYYESHGSGEPLVLLHGFTGSGRAWGSMVEKFAAQYRVIVPDLRGHGYSTNPSGKFTHRQSALDVYALLDHLGIDKFSGIGSSTGGMTLIHMATSQPERVRNMILVGATIYFPEQAREIMRHTDPDNVPEERMENLQRTHKHGDQQIRDLLREFNGFKDSYDDMNFTAPFLTTIQARTLIVHGDRDKFFPVDIPLQMYENIPHSWLWVVPNGGHGPINEFWHDTFIATVLDFLKGEWGSDKY